MPKPPVSEVVCSECRNAFDEPPNYLPSDTDHPLCFDCYKKLLAARDKKRKGKGI